LLTAAGVEWKAIQDAGHWPFLDRRAEFIEDLVGFLDRLA
jgi:pimeloyl-ACP methyl ester carboxylesterase